MKIGIIVHSQTNNTFSVAEKIQEKLEDIGHEVTIEKVIASNDRENDVRRIVLVTKPNIHNYEAIIFGAPVRGGGLSPILKAYLNGLDTIGGKDVGCFVTEYFPYPWMGGNRAIKQMISICNSKSAVITETCIINWSSKKRNKQISTFVEKQPKLFHKSL